MLVGAFKMYIKMSPQPSLLNAFSSRKLDEFEDIEVLIDKEGHAWFKGTYAEIFV